MPRSPTRSSSTPSSGSAPSSRAGRPPSPPAPPPRRRGDTNKPVFTTHLDTGDGVIVINAEKVRVTGRKAQNKMVYRHSGYPGGLKTESLGSLLKTKPERVISDAVRGMLPHTRVGGGARPG